MPRLIGWCKIHKVLYLPDKKFEYKCPACYMWKVVDYEWSSAIEIGMREVERVREGAKYWESKYRESCP